MTSAMPILKVILMSISDAKMLSLRIGLNERLADISVAINDLFEVRLFED